MTSEVETPRGGRLLLAGDAFLFAAAAGMLLNAVLMGLVLLLAGGDPARVGEALGPLWGSVLSLAGSFAVVTAGAFYAWRAHGRRLSRAAVLEMVAGVVAGMVLVLPVFSGAAMLLTRASEALGLVERGGPPWAALGLVAALALALVGVPVVDAVRDLAGRRAYLRLDVARLVAFAVLLLLAVASLLVGAMLSGPMAEAGEAGVFAALFAVDAVFAVVGADIIAGLRRRPEPPTPSEQTA